VAGIIQGLAGFGFSLFAASAFLLLIGSGEAVQLLIVINLAISLALIGPLWKDADRTVLKRFVGGALIGLPSGLVLFKVAAVEQLELMVGVVILLFVGASVMRSAVDSGSESTPGVAGGLATGVLAGAMTTSLGMPGPPAVVYLLAVGLSKDATRATTLTFFVFAYAASLILQLVMVGVDRDVWLNAAVLVPVAMLASAIGHRLSSRVSEKVFRVGVLLLLAGTGIFALAQALT
jgi:uncharacterized membrane protein YfcA